MVLNEYPEFVILLMLSSLYAMRDGTLMNESGLVDHH